MLGRLMHSAVAGIIRAPNAEDLPMTKLSLSTSPGMEAQVLHVATCAPVAEEPVEDRQVKKHRVDVGVDVACARPVLGRSSFDGSEDGLGGGGGAEAALGPGQESGHAATAVKSTSKTRPMDVSLSSEGSRQRSAESDASLAARIEAFNAKFLK